MMADNDPDTPQGPPERIGRYRIVEQIGRGGKGIVYRARDEAMDRDVAVKVMITDLEDNSQVRSRFHREAQATARLSHPNILTIFDVGEDGDRFYIVMELLRGTTLKEFIAKAEVPLERKLDLMIQLCTGLGAAHNASIYHRDIKPGNLFVGRDGTLKLLDFGVARLATSSATGTGVVVGTPDYMSPEQARGDPIDGRSDIFSAGGVFYFMLTGRKPFPASDLRSALHQEEPERPLPLRSSEAPPELAQVVMKALAWDMQSRYQTCQDLMADLVRLRPRYSLSTRNIEEAVADEVPTMAARPARVATDPAPTDETVDVVPPSASDSGDTVTISAPSTWTKQVGDRVESGGVALPKLVVMRDGAVEGERPLTGERLRIGRDSQNDVVLDDPGKGVSRFHAEIRAERGSYTIVDLNSRNGVWLNGERVPAAALGLNTLGLNTRVTLGAFQLSVRGQPVTHTFDSMSPAGSADISLDRRPARPVRPDRTASNPLESRQNAANSGRLWIGAAVALLVVSVGAFAILRHREPGATSPSSPVVEAPPAQPAPAVPDHRQEVDQYLDDARAKIASKDYDGALSSLHSALELEPTDPDAGALKDEVEAAKAALVSPPPQQPLPPPQPVPAQPPARPPAPVDAALVAGISRTPGESSADYSARAKRVQDNYSRSKASLEKKEYQAALDALTAVERDQPGYQDVQALLAETHTELHEAAREAMDNASKNEAAGEWYAALQWYRYGEGFESTPELVQRMRAVQERVTREAYSAFDRATALRKSNQTAKAILEYQKVRDWLPPDDEKRKEALKQLQALRQ
jgi:serine/threonine protein kinase/predicted component of type VI protein secretion system